MVPLSLTEFVLAGHLRFADHIVVLNKEGGISEQGTLEQVSASGGYVQRLASLPAAVTSRPELELSEETYRELGLPDEEDDLGSSRQTSDFQVYIYYIRVAGGWTFSVYLIICAAYTFGLSFPCRCSRNCLASSLLTPFFL